MIPQNIVSRIIRKALKGNLEIGAENFQMIPEHRIQLCWEQFQTKVRWDPSTSENDVYYAFLERAANRYTDMLSKWKRRFELAREDVKKKSTQCKKNRESELAGEGTGMSRHRGGAKFVIERARDYEINTGQPASEWQLALNLHGPKTPGGSYTYGKIENLIHKVEEEAAQLSQAQNESSAGENESGPPVEIDMSQIFVQKTSNQKGRMVGLGNLGKSKKLTAGSSNSFGSIFSNQVVIQTQMIEIQQRFNQELLSRDAKEEHMRNELNQLKMLVEQLTRGGGAGDTNTTGGSGAP